MLLQSDAAIAQTPVSGTIESDTTWSSGGSPYLLDGNVIVAPGVTVTIEPGVVVEALAGASLIVLGDLQAKGRIDEPIVFRSRAATRDWVGIALSRPRDSYPPDALAYVQIRNAFIGLTIVDTNPDLASLTFEDNGIAVQLTNPFGDIVLEDSSFLSNSIAITGKTRDSIHISGSLFWNNEVNLRAEPQEPFDCGPDAGIWDIRGNDILRGPANQEYFSFDMQTSPGSADSPFQVIASDNWWGPPERDGRQDYWARFIENGSCCPSPATKQIHVATASSEPQTDKSPPGTVPQPTPAGFVHSDPIDFAVVVHPEHGSCIDRFNFRRILTGSASAIAIELCGETSRGRLCWSHAKQRLVPQSQSFSTTEKGRYRFRRALPPGRYTLVAESQNEYRSDPGRNFIQFTLTD